MSLMANAVASSKTFSEGMSPLPILQKMQSDATGVVSYAGVRLVKMSFFFTHSRSFTSGRGEADERISGR